jgi:hypothetical protein
MNEFPEEMYCPKCNHPHLDYLDEDYCVSCGCKGPSWYDDYLQSHANYSNKLFHFIGFLGIILVLLFNWTLIPIAIVFDLILGAIGHYYFENNKPFFTYGKWYHAIFGYLFMNVEFFWHNKIMFSLGFIFGVLLNYVI